MTTTTLVFYLPPLCFALLSSSENARRFGPVFVLGRAAAASAAANAWARGSSPARRLPLSRARLLVHGAERRVVLEALVPPQAA